MLNKKKQKPVKNSMPINSSTKTASQNLSDEQSELLSRYENNDPLSTDVTKMTERQKKKYYKKLKRHEKIDMYDMIMANILAKNSIMEPTQKLDSSQLAIGFNSISSDTQLMKYFMINKFPDFIQPRLIDILREKCSRVGVKINFYFYGNPHRIDWDSPEMKNRMNVWRQYSTEHAGPVDVFSYRTQRGESLARQRIITSTKYINEAELEYKRSFIRTYFIIEVSAKRSELGLTNLAESIIALKDLCSQSDIKLTEIRINMIDWLREIGPFCLANVQGVDQHLARKVLTDDVLANFNSYKQGRVGARGVPLGIDILSGGPVMRKFKEDPDEADNWLISADTGGGKSYWVKTLLTYLMADGFIVSVMDYEGDEYTNLANYIREGCADDVKIVSMGKGSSVYFDPCEIPDLTGDPQVDNDLKESAIMFTTSIFRVIVCGLDDNFTKPQERVISLAIQRMYDTAGVTEDKATWHRSRGLRLLDVYSEIKEMVETKELVDSDSDNDKHKAAVQILDATAVYFEEGESKATTFKMPMSANELYMAKLIIFSFGMKGVSDSATDPTILALKQLSVAYINIQISNYCKYVRHCFNVKVFEEFQRWNLSGTGADVISNVITGGRKRGDVTFIITNDLASMLDDSRPLNVKIRQNIQNYAIGKIPDKGVRETFCEKFDQQEILPALDAIAKANKTVRSGSQKTSSNSQNKYKNAFCLMLGTGEKAIVKVKLPESLAKSKLFKTGVVIDGDQVDR